MPGKVTQSTQEPFNDITSSEGTSSNINVTGTVTLLVLVILAIMLYPRMKAASDNEETRPLSNKEQFAFMYVIFGGLMAIIFAAGLYVWMILPGILLSIVLYVHLTPSPPTAYSSARSQPGNSNPECILYHGYNLDFTITELEKTLNKHLPYFTLLETDQQQIFIKRLRKFMQRKNFIIHDTSGFKEMPILISAAAIQLSFGLKKYLLPIFREIHIYPDEFVNYHQSLRIVIGNVSNNRINISWKHFLDGFKLPDGVNVGLHEMAHAYHYQNFAALDDMDEHFIEGYNAFEERSRTALLYELSSLSTLYTLYGLSNEQEFWAESVELFFEKTVELKALDKSLYQIISNTLNQGIA
jgi:Mlc titration factor MtfA (ptsG expression regulator)